MPLEQEMLSGHVEGQLLKMLVHATRARHVLEVGMFTGCSALAKPATSTPSWTKTCSPRTGWSAWTTL